MVKDKKGTTHGRGGPSVAALYLVQSDHLRQRNNYGVTETHLNQSHYSSENFPDSCAVLRKDRVEGAGGVFIGVKREFNVSEECV